MTTNNGTGIRVLAATGVCGSGFREASLVEAMRRQPHFIGCDSAAPPTLAPTRLGSAPRHFREWQLSGTCA